MADRVVSSWLRGGVLAVEVQEFLAGDGWYDIRIEDGKCSAVLCGIRLELGRV